MEARLELQKEIDENNKEDAIEMRSVVNVMESKIRFIFCTALPLKFEMKLFLFLGNVRKM